MSVEASRNAGGVEMDNMTKLKHEAASVSDRTVRCSVSHFIATRHYFHLYPQYLKRHNRLPPCLKDIPLGDLPGFARSCKAKGVSEHTIANVISAIRVVLRTAGVDTREVAARRRARQRSRTRGAR
jgi:hypothetical protein